jgi:hypothetical protein
MERSRFRHIILALLAIPPLASVAAGVFGLVDLQASIVVLVTSVVALQVIHLEATLQSIADRRSGIRAFRNDDEAMPHLRDYVVATRPRAALLLEYSGFGAMPLLTKLGDEGSTKSVRLLVAHPDAAISDYQRDYRLAEALRTLAYRIPIERARDIGLEVRCYKESASVRGRLVGDLVILGWYSFDDRGLAQPGQNQISGGSNALVSSIVHDSVGQRLGELYSRVFENLWTAATPANEAWKPHRSRILHLPSEEWLRAVGAPK